MVSSASVEGLCGCLRRILASLEKGDPIEAAGMVPELNALVSTLPVNAPEKETENARQLLGRCAALEDSLRGQVVESMRRLGAVRKSMVYRRFARRP